MSLHRPIPRMEPDPKLLAFVTEHPDIPTVVRQRAAFFVFFTQTIYPLLEEQRPILDRLYCATNGRPAVDPVGLLGALLLQFVERLPDRQAAEAVGERPGMRLLARVFAENYEIDATGACGLKVRLQNYFIGAACNVRRRSEFP